jgi:hypothetical protein
VSYTATKPTAKTMAILVGVLAAAADVRTFLGVADANAAKARIIPADGGLATGTVCGWLGASIAAAPPLIIVEADKPAYAQRSEQTWNVVQQYNLHLLHGATAGDTAIDAYLRAWDEVDSISAVLRASAAARTFEASGIFVVQEPVVFGTQAPEALQGKFLSALAITVKKGQP